MGEAFKGYVEKNTPVIQAAKIRRVNQFGAADNKALVELTGARSHENLWIRASVRPVRGDFVVLVDEAMVHMQKADFVKRYQGAQ